MNNYKVILPSVTASLEARPYETLKYWIASKYSALGSSRDANLAREEIQAEIVNVFMLLFRSKEALGIAFDLLEHDYDDARLVDFCRCYSSALKEMCIEVLR
jgi:hypothetical protein